MKGQVVLGVCIISIVAVWCTTATPVASTLPKKVLGEDDYLDDPEHDLLPDVVVTKVGQVVQTATVMQPSQFNGFRIASRPGLEQSWEEVAEDSTIVPQQQQQQQTQQNHQQQQTPIHLDDEFAVDVKNEKNFVFAGEQSITQGTLKVRNSDHVMGAYPFECSSRTFADKTFSAIELRQLHHDLSPPTTPTTKSNWWRISKGSETDAESSISFAVNTANSKAKPIEQAATLAVMISVLEPFEHYNTRTAVCATINHLVNHGIALNEKVHFWDVAQQIEGLHKNAKFGHVDDKGNFQVSSISSELAAVGEIGAWLSKNTHSM